jgi:hypothetical protein
VRAGGSDFAHGRRLGVAALSDDADNDVAIGQEPDEALPSTTGIGPTSSFAISFAASATGACEAQLAGFEVITSRTCVIGDPSFRACQ